MSSNNLYSYVRSNILYGVHFSYAYVEYTRRTCLPVNGAVSGSDEPFIRNEGSSAGSRLIIVKIR